MLRSRWLVCSWGRASTEPGGLLPSGWRAEPPTSCLDLDALSMRRPRLLAAGTTGRREWVTLRLLQDPEIGCPQSQMLAICGNGAIQTEPSGNDGLHGFGSGHITD